MIVCFLLWPKKRASLSTRTLTWSNQELRTWASLHSICQRKERKYLKEVWECLTVRDGMTSKVIERFISSPYFKGHFSIELLNLQKKQWNSKNVVGGLKIFNSLKKERMWREGHPLVVKLVTWRIRGNGYVLEIYKAYENTIYQTQSNLE